MLLLGSCLGWLGLVWGARAGGGANIIREVFLCGTAAVDNWPQSCLVSSSANTYDWIKMDKISP